MCDTYPNSTQDYLRELQNFCSRSNFILDGFNFNKLSEDTQQGTLTATIEKFEPCYDKYKKPMYYNGRHKKRKNTIYSFSKVITLPDNCNETELLLMLSNKGAQYILDKLFDKQFQSEVDALVKA